jgi:threonylcarbamoyladenosine tRNA methylthiotransferase MtaB
MKIAVLTIGCKTNQAESLAFEQSLSNNGHSIVELSEKPDLCIINTCTVTSKADYQSRQLVNRALKSDAKVIVTGCYAEINHDKLKKADSSIEIIKNTEKDNIINLIKQDTSSNTRNIASKGLSRHRPFVKVQDGCNYSCSYCAITIARGRSRSIPIENVINEIKSLESADYKEVVLTGIHLGTYGLDLKPKKTFSDLLRNILIKTKIPRIRISSMEVKEIDEELLELMTDERVCRHLHVPLQSGDDNILKLMNRTYTVYDFISGIEMITKKFPDISIGTDVIAGFPGEGDVEFNNTKKLIESMPFSYLHAFPYSRRPGTMAAAFKGHVPEAVKKERVAVLRGIGTAKKTAYIKKNIGKILDVVIENRTSAGFTGTAGNYIKVFIDNPEKINEGMLVRVVILEIRDMTALAKVENVSEPLNK